MGQVYSRVVGVLLAALALAGCGGGGSEEPRRVGETDGFAVYEVTRAGFSVGVPSDWETISVEDAFSDEQLGRMRTKTPELAPFIDALEQPNSPMKFLAFDVGSADLNVIVEPLPAGMTREEYFDLSVAQIEEIFDPVGMEVNRADLPAGDALALSYEQSKNASGRRLATFQYVLYDDETGYVLTYSTLPDSFTSRRADFERSARSFRIL